MQTYEREYGMGSGLAGGKSAFARQASGSRDC